MKRSENAFRLAVSFFALMTMNALAAPLPLDTSWTPTGNKELCQAVARGDLATVKRLQGERVHVAANVGCILEIMYLGDEPLWWGTGEEKIFGNGYNTHAASALATGEGQLFGVQAASLLVVAASKGHKEIEEYLVSLGEGVDDLDFGYIAYVMPKFKVGGHPYPFTWPIVKSLYRKQIGAPYYNHYEEIRSVALENIIESERQYYKQDVLNPIATDYSGSESVFNKIEFEFSEGNAADALIDQKAVKNFKLKRLRHRDLKPYGYKMSGYPLNEDLSYPVEH